MQQEHEAASQTGGIAQDSFLGSFSRVPNGLDPTQVYSYFLKVQARLRQLEEQAKQSSAPFILEAALREAAEARSQAAQAAERTYNDIVRVAQQEGERARAEGRQDADRVRAEAQQQAQATLAEARASVSTVEQESERLRAEARDDAARIRRQAVERNEQDEQELERLCVDFANLLQRLLDRRKAAADDAEHAAVPPGPAGSPPPARPEERPTPTIAAPSPAPAGAPRPISNLAPAAPGPAAPSAPPLVPPPAPVSPGPAASGDEHHDESWAAELRSEPRANPAAAEAWPDDWSFAKPGDPAPAAADAEHEAPRPQVADADHDEPPRKSAQDGPRGFRLPSWLDM